MAQPDPAGIVVDAAVLKADVATLDLLARRQLAARRMGRHILLRDPSPALRRLIAFAGLEPMLRVDPRG
jgi:anti-anti-sigma regulatory factor